MTVALPVDFQLPSGFESDETGDLVARAKSGDAEALNELFARYHRLMVEIARRKLGSRLRLKEEPDDLAQTTFREATRDFRNYHYRGEGSLVRWLVQILQNKIRDRAEFYGATKRDLSALARVCFFALIALILFGIVLIFVNIPNGQLIYAVLGLVIFAGFTMFDFQRLRRSTDMRAAPLLAASIFLDILNVFLFFLQIFSGDDR
jgi:hypothetical protein